MKNIRHCVAHAIANLDLKAGLAINSATTKVLHFAAEHASSEHDKDTIERMCRTLSDSREMAVRCAPHYADMLAGVISFKVYSDLCRKMSDELFDSDRDELFEELWRLDEAEREEFLED